MGGLVGMAALGGGAACLPRGLPRQLPQSELSDIIGSMDESLEKISRYDMLDDFTRRANIKARHSDDDRMLVQASVKSLYASAFFRGLSEEAQLHPDVQERMFAQLNTMDDAIYGMTDRMSTLDEDQRRFVKAALHDRKTEPEAVSQLFDQGMSALKLPMGRRFQARSIFSKIGWQLQKQPAVVIDEYVTKVQKATAQMGSQVDLQRRIAAQMGQEAYWKRQNQLALMLADDPGGGAASNNGGLMPPGSTPVGPPGPPPTGAPVAPPIAADPREIEILMSNIRFAAQRNQCETVLFLGRRIADLDPQTYRDVYLVDPGVIACKEYMRQKRGLENQAAGGSCDESDARSMANKMAHDKVVGTGGWMLGIGLISGVVSALLLGASASDGAAVLGAIGLTVGAALLVGGLIVVIVGAGMASS
jgi:hypothetical protein